MRVILQSESAECGLACLAMVADHYGYHTDLGTLRRRFSFGVKGASLSQIIDNAAALNFSARPVRLEVDQIGHLRRPCILHWNMSHFVVLKDVKRGINGHKRPVIVDPAFGEYEVADSQLSNSFTGEA